MTEEPQGRFVVVNSGVPGDRHAFVRETVYETREQAELAAADQERASSGALIYIEEREL